MPPCQEDSRSFFEKLQNAEGLDLRDNRGKRHDLAVVLVGVTIAVLSNRDGCLSSIHRHLVNHYEKLVLALGIEKKRVVSRSQLPLILEKVAVRVFDRLVFENYGINLNCAERKWFALDGKELRGSIEKGSTRGEAVVVAIAHESRQSFAQDYYSGKKESEVKVVRGLLKETGLGSEKMSLDALHCKPKTLLLITQARGKYVVGLKENQKQLLKQVSQAIEQQAVLYKSVGFEKGHGRIETRGYEFYDILEMTKADRWQFCQMRTVIKVSREREEVKTGKKSQEQSYYVSNEVGRYEQLSKAIRDHWQVETANHIRDCTLKEDKMRSKKRLLIE
ncbi:MAG: ISAs1 family transposase [Acidobacteria bacterium]|jgi:predicted transposase YbfD/YdcC|nr:ISAs1 family transposase [Acidobacteriota bacterium]